MGKNIYGTAVLKRARISAQKCRLVIDLIRGKKVSDVINILSFMPNKSAGIVKKLLYSALSNADHNSGADVDKLLVLDTFVSSGGYLKRMRCRAKGRGDRIRKGNCNITVKVGY